MFKNLVLIIIIILSIFQITPVNVYSGSNYGVTTAEFLKFDVGAAYSARGGAVVAQVNDVYSLYYNPAGLAELNHKEISFMHNSYLVDVNHEYLALGSKFKFGSIGLSFSLVNYGEEKITTYNNPFGNNLGTFNGKDMVFQLGYAKKIYERLNVGISGKYIQSKIKNFKADGLAFDLGFQYKLIEGIQIGAAYQNLGSKLKYISDSEDLPRLFKIGIGYEYKNKLKLGFDMVNSDERNFSYRLGSEYKLIDMFKLRAGYVESNDAGNGLTLGAGFLYKNFSIDYAYIPFGDIGDAHKISFDYKFGRIEVEEVEIDKKEVKIEVEPEVEKEKPALKKVPERKVQKKEIEIPEGTLLERLLYERGYRKNIKYLY